MQANDTITKLKQNRVHTISDLATFPLDKLSVLKLKPKARSILRTVIPKLAGSCSIEFSTTYRVLSVKRAFWCASLF